MDICPCCGELAYIEVTDVLLETRELNLDACCEWNLARWIESIQNFSRRERVAWMLHATGLVVHDILAGVDTLRWTLHYGLELLDISFTTAKEFIQAHHRHCDPPLGWKYGKALFKG